MLRIIKELLLRECEKVKVIFPLMRAQSQVVDVESVKKRSCKYKLTGN